MEKLNQNCLGKRLLLVTFLWFYIVQGLALAQTPDLVEYKDEYIQQFSNVVSFVIDRSLTSDEINRLQEASTLVRNLY